MARTHRRRSAVERGAAWVVTGPLGRLFSFALDVLVLWTRWAISRLRRKQRPASRRAL